MSVTFTGRCCARCSLLPSLRTLWPVAAATKQQSRGFTAPGAPRDSSATASAPCAAAAEAFPFLRQQKDGAMAAVPPTFGTMAASMTKEAAGRVQVVRDMDSFEAEFTQIAKATNSVAKFLVIDVDEVPRAAYHCGVEHPCTFVVQYNCDAFRRRIADPDGIKTPQQLVNEFKAALDACLSAVQQQPPPQQQVEWYTHSIPVDNLNVYRVNWPTA